MSISENRADPHITARITGLVARLGGQGAVARVLGVSQPGVRRWVTGESRISFETVIELARAADVSVEWVASGVGASPVTPMNIPIPHYGATPDGQPFAWPNDVDTITVHRDFFAQNRLDANNTGIVRVAGNAMAPSLPDGALAIIDMRVKLFQEDGVYVMGHPNGFIVRRVSIRGERAYFKTDNPTHGDTYAAPEDMLSVPIWGRVAIALTQVR